MTAKRRAPIHTLRIRML